MPAPVSRHSLPSLEAAIVATGLRLSEHLAHLAWCSAVGRDTTVVEPLVRSAELCLETLWQERDRRLVHEKDGHA